MGAYQSLINKFGDGPEEPHGIPAEEATRRH
jgi:hypothetical protein